MRRVVSGAPRRAGDAGAERPPPVVRCSRLRTALLNCSSGGGVGGPGACVTNVGWTLAAAVPAPPAVVWLCRVYL